ncbi:MAG: hypothetical protein AB8B82_10875 [Roseovarius sp.]
MTRRVVLGGGASVLAMPVAAFELSLHDRAKFKSFGGDDWYFNDPFERSRPGTVRLPYEAWQLKQNRSQAGQLLDLIAFAEAGAKQYDAVHFSAKRRPPGRPTQITIAQIFSWTKATPGQHHAIGRYQFIPSTLVALVRRSGISTTTRFSPKVQDQLAMILLQDAGYDRFMAGTLSQQKFMRNLAKIWAGLPLANGKSYYQGYATNRATISRAFYETQMRQIFA